jgi:hypothetical protein
MKNVGSTFLLENVAIFLKNIIKFLINNHEVGRLKTNKQV